MNKNRIRLTESQLQRVIKESVKRVLKENTEIPLETINEYVQQLLNMFPYSGNKFTPFLRLAAKKQNKELGEAVSILCDINQLVYRLRNCDYVWRGNNGGESYKETQNRWRHEQD